MRSRDLIKLVAGETGIPNYSDPGCTVWKNTAGKYHRDFGPAITGPNGTLMWFKNGQRHREDGPAVVWPNGKKEWWVNGRRKRAPIREA